LKDLKEQLQLALEKSN